MPMPWATSGRFESSKPAPRHKAHGRNVASLQGNGLNVDWPAVATDFGFYDQSHLIQKFNDLVGLSPGQFLNG